MKKLTKWTLILTLMVGMTWKVQDVLSKNNEIPVPDLVAKNGTCLGLNYHRIKSANLWNKTVEAVTGSDSMTRYNVYEDDFIDQISWLKQQDVHFATLDDVSRYVRGEPISEKCVWISFDDVDHTVFENAFPILKAEQVPFTLFVITGQVGQTFQNLQLAPWDELREMKESGLVDFGSHTDDFHYIQGDEATFLNPINHEAFQKDVIRSRNRLKEELGVDVTSIAYPFGGTNDEVTAIVEKAGYTDSFILSPNPITNESTPFFIDRYLLDQHVFEHFVQLQLK